MLSLHWMLFCHQMQLNDKKRNQIYILNFISVYTNYLWCSYLQYTFIFGKMEILMFFTCFHFVSNYQFCHSNCFLIFQMYCGWCWETALTTLWWWWWTLNTFIINPASSIKGTKSFILIKVFISFQLVAYFYIFCNKSSLIIEFDPIFI